MKEYRNPEFRHELIVYAAVTVLFTALGFIVSPWCALIVFIAGGAFVAVHFYFARKRYDGIAELCMSIDKILHGDGKLDISENEEGELAILKSEIHKMTVRLREQSDALLADKIMLTDAIADIFHQMRTPITSMNIMLSLLSEEELFEDRRVSLTRELKKQLEKTTWLVETLLKMSKIDAGTALFREDHVSVSDLVTTAVEPFLIPMELKGIELRINVSDESFSGDLTWSAEAISNLIKNCMEHTPAGGTIDISASESPLYTEIKVKDSGEGFSEEDIPHLFERFYKGKNASSESIGIGLALSRMIISSQNGTLAAANDRNGGALFTARFYKSIV